MADFNDAPILYLLAIIDVDDVRVGEGGGGVVVIKLLYYIILVFICGEKYSHSTSNVFTYIIIETHHRQTKKTNEDMNLYGYYTEEEKRIKRHTTKNKPTTPLLNVYTSIYTDTSCTPKANTIFLVDSKVPGLFNIFFEDSQW